MSGRAVFYFICYQICIKLKELTTSSSEIEKKKVKKKKKIFDIRNIVRTRPKYDIETRVETLVCQILCYAISYKRKPIYHLCFDMKVVCQVVSRSGRYNPYPCCTYTYIYHKPVCMLGWP